MVRGRDIARSTTRLPAALREELGIAEANHRSHRHAKKPRLNSISTRKAARKEKRQSKHASRAPKPKSVPLAPPASKTVEKTHVDVTSSTRPTKTSKPGRAFEGSAPSATRVVMDPFTGKMASSSKLSASSTKAPTKLELMMREHGDTSTRESARKPTRALSMAEQQEEDEIAWLEHQLYGRKRKHHIEGDDVDDLLDDLDQFHPGMYDEDEDDHADLAGLDSDANVDEDSEAENEEEITGDKEEEEDEEKVEDAEEGEMESEDFRADDEQVKSHLDERPENVQVTSSQASTTFKYVPPALRHQVNKSESLSVEQQKLRRHVNGQLNRLAEGNLDTIVSELEGLYRIFARSDVTSTITELCLDTIAARTNLNESIVVLYAALITSLHRLVGAEFGANVLQSCVSRFLTSYSQMMARSNSTEQGDESMSAWSRECANLIMLLCHLFNLKMLSAIILYDMVRLLLGKSFLHMVTGVDEQKPITEIDIELLLRIVQSSGQQLRHADGESLKAIVELTQQCMRDAPASAATVAQSSRARFMLESLAHLRQKGRHLGRESSATAESLQRLSKYVSSLERKRTVRAHSALQVGLQDLQDAEKRGRWWLVGAAWTGKDDSEPVPDAVAGVPISSTAAAAATPKSQGADLDASDDESTIDLTRLARTQGMNTDARRMVFSTLMSSLDYMDAAHNLMQLKLNDVQRREVIRVLVHCLSNVRMRVSRPIHSFFFFLFGSCTHTLCVGARIQSILCVDWPTARARPSRYACHDAIRAMGLLP